MTLSIPDKLGSNLIEEIDPNSFDVSDHDETKLFQNKIPQKIQACALKSLGLIR